MPHRSENKQAFLNGYTGDGPYKIRARDIEPLIDHYSQKGIRIIKNGQLSSLVIRQKQTEINLTIQKLEDSSINYATYLQTHFQPSEFASNNFNDITSFQNCAFFEHYSEISTSIKKYLNSEGDLKEALSTKELNEINTILTQLSCKELFDQQIKSKIKDLKKHVLPNACLTKAEAMQEVEKIRRELKEDEIVAYIFTNNKNIDSEHFEVLIITKKAIIKPVIWSGLPESKVISSDDILAGIPLYAPELDSFFATYWHPFNPSIQADGSSCGSLGIAILKKLLQNNALELKSFSLMFSFYHSNFPNKKKHFFFPSPSMLRYSQSSKYILFLEKILRNTDSVDYEYNKLFTLKTILLQSIQIATKNKDTVTVEQNLKILDGLPAFRQKWLSAIETIKQQRDEMKAPKKDPESGIQYNLYLTYTSRRLEKLANQTSSSSASFFSPAAPIDPTEIESFKHGASNFSF